MTTGNISGKELQAPQWQKWYVINLCILRPDIKKAFKNDHWTEVNIGSEEWVVRNLGVREERERRKRERKCGKSYFFKLNGSVHEWSISNQNIFLMGNVNVRNLKRIMPV